MSAERSLTPNLSQRERGTAHVVFTGGGTGGHLFPGLAVAEKLRALAPAIRITFAGSGKELERRHAARAGFAYLALPCRPLSARCGDLLPFVVSNLAGCLAAFQYLRRERVSLVVGSGGYASYPMARAAALLGRPLVLLEQNAVPGRATRRLARSAAVVCTAFEQAAAHFPASARVWLTGNPVRLPRGPSGEERRPGASASSAWTGLHGSQAAERLLLVLGGSQGARSLNDEAPRALAALGDELHGWTVLHQAGPDDCDATAARYRALGVPARVVPFVDDLPRLMSQAELAICRAGGTTLAELAVHGVPALVVPYPHARDDHQRANARAFAAAGACRVIDPREGQPLAALLASHLAELVANEPLRTRMAAAMGQQARPDAAAQVAGLILSLLVGERGGRPRQVAKEKRCAPRIRV